MPVSAARHIKARSPSPASPQSRAGRSNALPLRAVMARLMLALMLLVAQQGTLLHALGHGFEALKQGSSQQQDHHHECCAAFHGMDYAAVAAPTMPVADRAAVAEIAQTDSAILPVFRAHFQSRAPPIFS
jgi:hypothetical protein